MTYYETLYKINKSICKKNAKLRFNNAKYIPLIDAQINYALYNCESNIEILTNAMKVASLIKLYQPFDDGNNRTGLIMFGIIINEFDYNFDYQKALKDLKKGLLHIPTIYNNSDDVRVPENILQYLSKEKASNGFKYCKYFHKVC